MGDGGPSCGQFSCCRLLMRKWQSDLGVGGADSQDVVCMRPCVCRCVLAGVKGAGEGKRAKESVEIYVYMLTCASCSADARTAGWLCSVGQWIRNAYSMLEDTGRARAPPFGGVMLGVLRRMLTRVLC